MPCPPFGTKCLWLNCPYRIIRQCSGRNKEETIMKERIYKYRIFELRKYELDRKDIIAVIDTTFAVVKRKPEKKSGLYGIRTL